MKKWFNKQSRLVQLLLLFFLGWFVEVLIRWDQWLNKKDVQNLVMALLGTFAPLALVDFIYCLLFNKMILCD